MSILFNTHTSLGRVRRPNSKLESSYYATKEGKLEDQTYIKEHN